MDFRKSSVGLYILAGLFGGGAVVEVEIGIEHVRLAITRLHQRLLEGAHGLIVMLDLAEGNSVIVGEQPSLRKALASFRQSGRPRPR